MVADPQALPARVGRYEIERFLGQGGMGRLYLAKDPMLGRPLAIKLIRDELEDGDVRARFMQEARAAGGLKHPNIVTVFDVGEHEGHPFIAMEFVAGETLGAVIERAEPMALGMKLHLTEQLCRGLAHAHRAGLVHRDVKPANLMVDDQGTLRILDFGIARIDGSGLTATGVAIGTLNYMSPEQVGGQAVDHRSDVFAVGAVFHELLSYQKAFPGTIQDGLMYRIVHGEPASLGEACPELDPAITEMATRAMRTHVDERYQDLDEMANALLDIRQRVDPSGSSATVPVGELETSLTPTAGSTRTSPTPASSSSSDRVDPARPPRPTPAPQPGDAGSTAPTITSQPSETARRGLAQRWWVWATGAAAALAATAVVVSMIPEPPAPDGPAPPRTASVPPRAVEAAEATPEPTTVATDPPTTSAPATDQAQSQGQTNAPEPPRPTPPTTPPSAVGAPGPAGADAANETPAETQLETLRREATNAYDRGDREAALSAASAVAQLVPDDASSQRLLEQLYDDALQTSEDARRAAAGASDSLFYQEAARSSARAIELRGTGQLAAATRAMWTADNDYRRARAGLDAAAPGAQAAVPLLENPAAEVPNPAAPLAQTAPPERVDTAAANAPAAITRALARYQAAYHGLDAAALESVYPNVPRAMLDAMESFSTYEVELIRQPPVISGDTATVETQLSFSARRKAGGTAQADGPATFEFRREGADWLIAQIDMSGVR
jgi:serine/threonine-protein kinase